jgi:xylan 1,4-beta-xylosidase
LTANDTAVTSQQRTPEADARADWERRIYTRLTSTADADDSLSLPAPTDVRAEPAVGHVRLSWAPVEGAAGYLIERTSSDGEPAIVSHGGSDVPAVAGTEFADTGLADGTEYHYRVAAVTGADQPAWHWSDRVSSGTAAGPAEPVEVRVDAATVTGSLDRVWHMVGSERLSQLNEPVDEHGNDIGAEFAEALRIAHDDLGVTAVRAHAILHDDVGVAVRNAEGRIVHDFSTVDEIYDQVLALGIRPVVELGFMPAALARDPAETVFGYRGIISPPSDWAEWHDLVHALATHLVERYGIDEVARWSFEVWNEPNLVVFWSGTQAEYFRLYDESARAVKSVDDRLRVGGPSTAAGEWVEALAAHAEANGSALDFVTTHTYGNLPLDERPSLKRHGFAGIPIWWTEWGVGHTHFGPIHDSVFGAAFVLSGFAAVQGRMEALAYWVVSDHFEELGRPPRLFHNGFGLLTVGNLRKPRYWAVHLAAQLGDDVLASTVSGDGADVLVQSWASRHDDGSVDVLAWSGSVNAEVKDGDPRLDRDVRLTVDGLARDVTYSVEINRIDEQHSNIPAACPVDIEWPDAQLWADLRAKDVLHSEQLPDVSPTTGTVELPFALPMPGVVRLRLAPARPVLTDEEKN